MKTTILMAMTALLTGCASVPTTVIRVIPESRTVEIESPKDVGIEKFKFDMFPTATGTVVNVSFDKYESKNNIEVIRAVAERNAAMQKEISESSGALLGEILSHAK